MKTILLAEDDFNLAHGLKMNLEAEGYEVVHIADGSDVITEFHRGNFDLILLDIMLPGLDGFSICNRLRDEGQTVPILFLTARNHREDRVEGLLSGGDDYITKPFDMAELLARIQGIFRRQAWLNSESGSLTRYEFDGRSIDFKTFEALGPSGSHVLTRREAMVAKYLVERVGEVVSRDQLLDAVWGYQTYPTSRTIDNFVLRLRKIFENDPHSPDYFETIRGVGYRFLGPQGDEQENKE